MPEIEMKCNAIELQSYQEQPQENAEPESVEEKQPEESSKNIFGITGEAIRNLALENKPFQIIGVLVIVRGILLIALSKFKSIRKLKEKSKK